MKVIEWFDYLYYRTYGIYNRKWKDNMPRLYALCLVTILQVFNLSSFLFGYIFIVSSTYRPDKIHGVVVFFMLLFINRNRYHSGMNNYENLSKKWNEEAEEKRKKKGYLVVFYVVLSFILFFALASILGSEQPVVYQFVGERLRI